MALRTLQPVQPRIDQPSGIGQLTPACGVEQREAKLPLERAGS